MTHKFNSSYIGLRSDLLKYIKGNNLSILDVGCATGINGKFLLEKEIAVKVHGIELNEEMGVLAQEFLNKVFIGDLNNRKFRSEILNDPSDYDYILFGDILEHLLNPEIVLKDLVSKLKTDGKVIISLPNIAHLETFIQVFIKGSWPRNERGIYDQTHLRWFTRKDAFKLVEDQRLKIESFERIYRARDKMGSKFNWMHKLIKIFNKDLVTFQYIIKCSNGK